MAAPPTTDKQVRCPSLRHRLPLAQRQHRLTARSSHASVLLETHKTPFRGCSTTNPAIQRKADMWPQQPQTQEKQVKCLLNMVSPEMPRQPLCMGIHNLERHWLWETFIRAIMPAAYSTLIQGNTLTWKQLNEMPEPVSDCAWSPECSQIRSAVNPLCVCTLTRSDEGPSRRPRLLD